MEVVTGRSMTVLRIGHEVYEALLRELGMHKERLAYFEGMRIEVENAQGMNVNASVVVYPNGLWELILS